MPVRSAEIDLEKALQLQESVAEQFLDNERETSLSNIPNKSVKTDISSVLNGIGIIKDKQGGYMLKIYTDGYLSNAAIADYIGVATSKVIIDNIGDIHILLSGPKPGSHICHKRGALGTLGGFVKDGKGTVYALSNNHVLSHYFSGDVGDSILHPGIIDTGGNNFATVSRLHPVKFGRVSNEVDCGLAQLNTQNGVRNIIPGICSIAGELQADFDMAVIKNGMATGFTAGKINSIYTTIGVKYSLSDGSRRRATFKNQIEIAQDPAYDMFADDGDSGSLLIESYGYKVVGLIFAGTTSGRTFANHIGNVLKALEVELLLG